MPESFADDLPQLLDEVSDSMVELRHDLHAHPELAFQEFRTTQVITDRLTSLGFELRPCPTETGAVARLVGGRPGRRVMVRADIDGLPVAEECDLPYASVVDGVMHACGHDVHTASLLGVADILSRRRDELAGEFTLLFQPAEEVIGGAIAMIDGGVMNDNPVDAVIGAHVTSLAPVGVIATRSGVMMSDGQTLSVDIKGRGGHGAMSTIEGNVVLAVSEIAPRLAEVIGDWCSKELPARVRRASSQQVRQTTWFLDERSSAGRFEPSPPSRSSKHSRDFVRYSTRWQAPSVLPASCSSTWGRPPS